MKSSREWTGGVRYGSSIMWHRLVRGIVHVMQNANTVNIINPQGTGNTGSITLSKYVEDAIGLLSKPRNQAAIASMFPHRAITKSSHYPPETVFTETIGPLPSATYVIDELDHEDVSYIIDGGSPGGSRHCGSGNGTAHQVQVINRAGKGKRQHHHAYQIYPSDGMPMRPQKDVSYAPGIRKIFL